MNRHELFRHGVNIAKFMETMAKAFEDVTQAQTTQTQQGSPEDEEFVNYGKYGHPINLADIGLDDMNVNRVVVELSTDRSQFKIWAPYDESFVDEIKQEIPKGSRGWDPDEKCWRIDSYWIGNAQDIAHRHYPHLAFYYTNRATLMCEEIDRQIEEELRREEIKKQQHEKQKRRHKKNNSSSTGQQKKKKKRKTREEQHSHAPEQHDEIHQAYSMLALQPDAPDEVVKAAHKALSRKHHPDLEGGSTVMMKKINEAFETIKEHRGWNNQP